MKMSVDVVPKQSNLLTRFAQTADKTTLLLQKYHLTPQQLQLHLDADPTPNKKYLEWLIRQTTSQPPKLRLPEDTSKCVSTLTLFGVKKQFLSQKDINKYDSLGTLTQALEAVTGQTSKREKIRINTQQGQQLVAQDSDYKCLRITTEEAAATLCRQTEWCIKDPYYFRQYEISGSNPLYVFLKGDVPFALLNVKSGQFNDVYDKELSSEQKQQLSGLLEVLLRSGELYSAIDINSAKEAYNLCSLMGKRMPRLELVIMTDTECIYRYAVWMIKGRWFAAESTIMKEPRWAYEYVNDVIKGRWPEAEPYIMKEPRWTYEYANNVIKGKWLEAERFIVESPEWTYRYAKDVIKGRWLEAEHVIVTEPYWAYQYAQHVIQGRWLDAEHVISQHPYWAYRYAREVIKGRFAKAEPVIMEDPQCAYWYIKDVIQRSIFYRLGGEKTPSLYGRG